MKPVNNLNVKYSCHICSEEFLSINIYFEHVKSAHGNDQENNDLCSQFMCDDCKENFSSKTLLKNHTTKVHGRYECHFCNKRYQNNHILLIHITREHVNANAFRPELECGNCGNSFGSSTDCKKHEKSCCPLCKKNLENVAGLKKHIRFVHDKERPVQCNECHKKFVTKHTLATHMSEVHEGKRYACDLCDKVFGVQTRLNWHRNEFHDPNNIPKCDICGIVFRTRDILKRHSNSIHGKKPEEHKCEKCGKILSRKDKIIGHMSKVHGENSKPKIVHEDFKCNHCDKLYTQSHNLKTHIKNVHEGGKKQKKGPKVNPKRPLSCNQCDKSFTQSHNLKTHIKNVHEGHKNENVTCIFCGKSYTQSHNLKKHIGIVHKNQIDGHKTVQSDDVGILIQNEKYTHKRKQIDFSMADLEDLEDDNDLDFKPDIDVGDVIHQQNSRPKRLCSSRNDSKIIIHQDEIEGPKNVQNDKISPNLRLHCKYCDKTFVTELVRKHHIQMHEDEVMKSMKLKVEFSFH